MHVQKLYLPLIVSAILILSASLAWALGFELGESKEQLKLDYKVLVKDHGTGRVTVSLTIVDQGRLKPLDRGVDLVIPSDDGTGHVDLSVSLDTTEVDGKLMARVHLTKELARRAEIQLKTWTLDGKKEPLTWYYHKIPIAQHLESDQQKKD